MNPHNLQVGQEILVDHDYDRGRGPQIYRIKRIGRLYAILNDSYRVRLDTLKLDGGRGTVWLSFEARKASKELHAAWDNFVADVVAVRYRLPTHIDVAAIDAARRALGMVG